MPLQIFLLDLLDFLKSGDRQQADCPAQDAHLSVQEQGAGLIKFSLRRRITLSLTYWVISECIVNAQQTVSYSLEEVLTNV